MLKFLKKLKSLGFNPTNILDIGAYHGHWAEMAHNVFGNSNVTMVEPIDYIELKRFDDQQQFSYRNVLLDECEQMRDWYEMRNTGDSMYKEMTGYFRNCALRKRKTTTLDIEFRWHFSSGPELIKIDTQGAELPILKGGKETIRNNEIIIMEVPFVGAHNENVPNFFEHISYLEEIGYAPLEIVDQHIMQKGDYNYFAVQLDLAFVRKGHRILTEQQDLISSLGNRE
jgi:FkbM family methyltransferase